MTSTRKTLTVAATVVVIIVMVLYAIFQFQGFLSGPQVEIHEPKNGSVVHKEKVEISGKVKNVSEMTLNGRSVIIDDVGLFKESLLLAFGYNIMEIQAKDRFGRENSKTLEIIYK